MKEIILLQSNIEYTTNMKSLNTQSLEITIFGVTKEMVPIQVKIFDFTPYFYINLAEDIDIEYLKTFLKSKLNESTFRGLDKCMKKNIYGYSENKLTLYKLYFSSPGAFRSAKSILEKGIPYKEKILRVKVFESNFPFILRFMNDLKMTGMCYIKIPNYEVETMEPFIIKTSHQYIEVLPLEGEYLKILPLKILSFDIECCSSENRFPSATVDPVIQIGNTYQRIGSNELFKDIFCLKEVANIQGANVHWFDDEKEMLEAWQDYILEQDPDILLGYNIKNFDFPFLFERARVLNIKNFGKLGRSDKVSKVFKKTQTSSAFGSIETSDISLDGRMIFDLFHIIKRDHKLRSYSLNSVSAHFLAEQKEDVPHSLMYGLQNGDKETRRRIATYCLKDTYLPLRLFEKLNIFINFVELSRATHVPIEYFSTRGSSIKVLALIYKEASEYGFVIPDMEIMDNDVSFEGGFVMDPARGYYDKPIAVLDFTSLYPSIMITNNLCYTTLLSKEQYLKYKDDAFITPTGNYFMKKSKCEGLLPRILLNLIKNRKATKKLIKMTDDESLKKSLDGRQYALKICANSIYGFTGAQVGQLPCFEISQSTTSIGRELILLTKNLVESNFNKKNGLAYDSTVIYGDTDSVMINFYESSLKRVFEISENVANYITKKFYDYGEDRKEIKEGEKAVNDGSKFSIVLEFEKVYFPYILMNKKRYAGLIYNNPEKPNKIDTKGIEAVRRDNCHLLKKIIDECLNRIFYKRDITSAVEYVKEKVTDLYNDRVDLFDLIISKTYTKTNYAVKSAHVELVEKLKKRGVDVKIGDRIPYVIVSGGKNDKIYDKSEDPLYALENNIPIDIEYYIEHQLSNPIHRLFDPIMDNVSSLFKGVHVAGTKKSKVISGPLKGFLVVKDQCVGCGTPGTILCSGCRRDFPKYLYKIYNEYNEETKLFNMCWRECQRCMKSTMTEVICVNDGCPIFYKRIKVKKQIEELQGKVNKISSIEW